jgi:outer membrane receptor protein involved in Fe transport
MRISLTGFLVSACTVALANTNVPVSVLVNSQGWAQRDLSIRGSSYTGAGLSINGLNLKQPYSAHFNTELPFLNPLFSAPESRTGLDNVSGHLVGTTAYETAPQPTQLQADTRIGTKEHYQATLSGQAAGVGGFLDWEKARRIDHHANDLDRYAGGAHLQLLKNDWKIDALGGYQRKDFGAQGYYGLPSTIYAKDRLEDAMVFLGASRGDLEDSYFRASGAIRQLDDKYRIPTEGFESDVRSRFGALVLEGRTMEIQNIALNLRGDLEYEEVDGDIGDHDRTRGSVLILPQVTFERFRITGGLNSVFQTSESAEWLPQAGVDWFISDNSTLYTTYSETVQQPDFQTLHYIDPYRIGNSDLDLQQAKNSELGIRQFVSASLDWRAAAFYRRIEHASDWVKNTAADTAWSATDLGDLDVGGIETEINFYPSAELELNAFYQWVKKDDYNFYAGLYELDYPEHLVRFSGHWDFTTDLSLFATQTLRWQKDNNYRRHNDFGADASLGLHWFPRFAHNTRLSFLVDNLWGADFQEIAGLKPPKRSFSSGITIVW